MYSPSPPPLRYLSCSPRQQNKQERHILSVLVCALWQPSGTPFRVKGGKWPHSLWEKKQDSWSEWRTRIWRLQWPEFHNVSWRFFQNFFGTELKLVSRIRADVRSALRRPFPEGPDEGVRKTKTKWGHTLSQGNRYSRLQLANLPCVANQL